MPQKEHFDQRILHLSPEVWAKISQIDELKGQWIGGTNLSPQILGRLKRSVLVTSTGASTRIEGGRLSDAEVENLLRGVIIQKFTERDQQEVRGYYELLQNIFEAWKQIKFSESTIKHFHKELLKYVSKDAGHRGEYKKLDNKVVMLNASGKSLGTLFATTPPYLTSKKMQELVIWTQQALAEKKYHPLLVIANFIVEFLAIHPFQDGNGRLSRILTNLMLLQTGYLHIPYVSHEKLIEDNKPDYYLALRQSQKTFSSAALEARKKGGLREDITPWLNFFLAIFLKQSQMAVALLLEENIEQILSPKQTQVWQYLQKVVEASPAEISQQTCVARPTISQALDKLLRLKKVERIGLGRGTRYRRL